MDGVQDKSVCRRKKERKKRKSCRRLCSCVTIAMIDDDTSYFFDLMNTVSESIRQREHGTLQRGAE